MGNIKRKNTLFIEMAFDAFVAMDEKGRIVEWNHPAEEMFGWSRVQVLGKLLAQVVIPAQYREAHKKGLAGFLATGKGLMLNKKIELSALHQNGDEFPVELMIWPTKEQGGYRFNAFIRDIKESKELFKIKDDFVSNVSHELRTPMAIIREGVSQLLDGLVGEISDDQRRFLTVVLHSVDRLARIVGDLLDVSKLETGKIRLERTTFDLATLVKEMIQSGSSLFMQARSKGLQFKSILPNGTVEIYADGDRIRQVLSSLVGNALRFTSQGSIGINVADLGDKIECSVSDTGTGIAQGDIPKLFDKFQQFGRLAGPGAKGTGLGLAISKGIVELHGGKIRVESQEGKGSKFTFSLPKISVDQLIKEEIGNGIKNALKEEACFSMLVFSFGKLDGMIEAQYAQRIRSQVENSLRSREDQVLVLKGKVFVLLNLKVRQDTFKVAERLKKMLEESFEAEINCQVIVYPEDGHSAQELMQKVSS